MRGAVEQNTESRLREKIFFCTKQTFSSSGVAFASSKKSRKISGAHRLDQRRLADPRVAEDLHLDLRNRLSGRNELLDVVVTAILKLK